MSLKLVMLSVTLNAILVILIKDVLSTKKNFLKIINYV